MFFSIDALLEKNTGCSKKSPSKKEKIIKKQFSREKNGKIDCFNRFKKNIIIENMTQIEKFLSDIKRIIKYDRANNGGRYDGKRACTEISKLFARNNPNLGVLATSLSDYWLEKYILASENPENEPTEENIEKIKAFQCFVDNIDDESLDSLSAEDFENLKGFVDEASEELDLDALQNMMGILLDRGAI